MNIRKKTYKIIYFLKYAIIFFELLMFEFLINIRNKSSSISNKNLNQSKSIIRRNFNYKIKNLIKNKTNINTLIINGNMRFGNYFISLNPFRT
jgi:hypothetical protein